MYEHNELGEALKNYMVIFFQGFFLSYKVAELWGILGKKSATLTAEKIPKGVKSGPN